MFVRDSTGMATLGGLSVVQILSHARCATPAYVYDLDGMSESARRLRESFGSTSN